MSEPEGALKQQAFRDGGYSPDEIEQWTAQTWNELREGGYSDAEIQAYFGGETFDTKPLEQHFKNAIEQANAEARAKLTEKGVLAPETDAPQPSFEEVFKKGFGFSITGLLDTQQIPEDPGELDMLHRIVMQAGTLYGDLPAMGAGAILGGTAGGPAAPLTSLGGAFALPAGMRHVLMEAYSKGRIRSPKRFWEVASGALWEATKGYATGVATGAAGGAAAPYGLVPKVGAETVAMTTVGAALENRLPTPEEFADAALLMLALNSPKIVQKLRDTYHRTGIRPKEMEALGRSEPSVREDLASSNLETPRAVRDVEAKEAAKPSLPEGVAPPIETEAQRAQRALDEAAQKFQARAPITKEAEAAGYRAEEGGIRLPGYGAPLASSTGLASIGGAAQAISQNLRQQLWEAYKVGQTKMAGVEDPALRAARQAGISMTDRAAFDQFLTRYAAPPAGAPPAGAPPAGAPPAGAPPAGAPPTGAPPAPPPIVAVPPPPGPGTPLERVLSRISVGEEAPTPKGLKGWDLFFRDWLDAKNPLKDAVDAMAQGRALKTVEDAYKLSRLQPGNASKALGFLMRRPFEFETGRPVGKSLRKILKPVRNEIDALRGYVAAKRTMELGVRGIKTGIDVRDAVAVVQQYQTRMEPVLRELQEYQEHLLIYMKKAGLINDQQMTDMRLLNQDYVPFYRVLEEGEAGGPRAGRGLKVSQVLKRIYGSEEKIVDPLESIVKNTYLMIEMAERNGVLRRLVELAETSPVGAEYATKAEAPKARPITLNAREKKALINKAKAGQPLTAQDQAAIDDLFQIFRRDVQRAGRNQITVFRDGQREVWDVTPELYEVFEGADRASANLLFKIAQAPAKLLRMGTVTQPEYMVRNIFKDQFFAYMFAEHGYNPWNMARGIFHMIRRDDLYAEFERSGAPMSTFVSSDRAYFQADLDSILRRGGVLGALRNEIRHPLEMFGKMTEWSDLATRLGIFERARKAGVDIPTAGLEARSTTIDFQRQGLRAARWNRYAAFFTAQIGGVLQMVEGFKRNPARANARAIYAITLFSIVNHLYNRKYHDDAYQEIPQWQRDLTWPIPFAYGEDLVIGRLPKPQIIGWLYGTFPERVIDFALERDPSAFDGLIESIARDTAISVAPTYGMPVIEAWANKSYFMNRPLIPLSREGKVPELQSQPYTSETAKALGRILSEAPGMRFSRYASPAVIENFVRGWTGGMGMYALQITDGALRQAGIVPENRRPADTLADLPVVKGFVIRYPSAGAESIQKFYERVGEEETVLASLNLLAKEGDSEAITRLVRINQGFPVGPFQIRETLGEMSQVIRNLEKIPNETMSREQKRQFADQVVYAMIEQAKRGLTQLEAVKKMREGVAP